MLPKRLEILKYQEISLQNVTDITIRVFSMSGIHNVFFNRYSGTIFELEFIACLILQLPNLVNTHTHKLTLNEFTKIIEVVTKNFMKSISLLIKTIDHFYHENDNFSRES